MKKLAIVLLLLSGPAWAEWKAVWEENNGTSYADPATIVRRGDTVTMRSLLDYKTFQRMVEVGYFSQKSLVEYDCKEGRSRGLAVSLHAEHMGEGKVIYEDASPHAWEPVSPEMMSGVLWKIACK
jgi:hypothetical protein